jgi:hypothetical protein
MNKPMILIIEDFKSEMISIINNALQHGVPCYLLEPVMSDFCAQVKDGARNELQMAREQMNMVEQEEEQEQEQEQQEG